MKAVSTKPAAILTACAVCAMTFSSCAAHSRRTLNISESSGAQRAVTESTEMPVISSNPAAESFTASSPVSSKAQAFVSAISRPAPVERKANAGFHRMGSKIQTIPIGEPIVKGLAGFRPSGPIQLLYYDYNHAFYANKGSVSAIQHTIEKSLGNGFYQIKGVDPAKSIAFFNGRYFYQLDYLCPDNITYNGKTYLINTDADAVTAGTLGMAGDTPVYRIKGMDPSLEIGVDLKRGRIWAAFQLDSDVKLGSKNYEVSAILRKIPKGEKLKALGKAHGETAVYDAFANGDSIILHIDKTYETDADPVTPAAVIGSVPQSLAGTPFESMFMQTLFVRWQGRSYQINDRYNDNRYNSDAAQAALKKQLGAFLGNFQPDRDTSYPMYEIKGINPLKKIMVQNNMVYLEYDRVS